MISFWFFKVVFTLYLPNNCFFKANFTLNFPIGWSWSLRFVPS